MSVSLRPTFAADGYQAEPTVADLNEIITAVNEGGGGGGGILPPSYDETIPANIINISASAMTANALYLMEAPTRADDLTVAGLLASFGIATGNVRVSVYTFDGTTFTLLGSSPSTATPGTNVQTIALSEPVTVPGGVRRYYGIAADVSPNAFRVSVSATAITFLEPTVALKADSFNPPATMVKADLTTVTSAIWLRTVSSV